MGESTHRLAQPPPPGQILAVQIGAHERLAAKLDGTPLSGEEGGNLQVVEGLPRPERRLLDLTDKFHVLDVVEIQEDGRELSSGEERRTHGVEPMDEDRVWAALESGVERGDLSRTARSCVERLRKQARRRPHVVIPERNRSDR